MAIRFIVVCILYCQLAACNPNLKPISLQSLPKNFNYPIIEGESSITSDIFIESHDNFFRDDINNVMLLDYKGNLLWYKMGQFQLPQIHRNSKNETRYTFGELVGLNSHKYELVICNDKFEEINRVRSLEYGDIPAFFPYNHDYLYLDDGHYILLISFPLYQLKEFAIQEIKDGEVVYQWQSTHPNFSIFKTSNSTFDFAHPNSIVVDPEDGNFIVSCRNLGFFKLNKRNHKIEWAITRTFNSFNLDQYQIPQFQHTVYLEKDGSIVLYDDNGFELNNARILRYWLDEENKKLIRFREYIYHQPRVERLGGAQILDDEKDIIGVTYGGENDNNKIIYEEYDFKHDRSLLRIKFRYGQPSYRVWRNLN